MTSTAHEDQFLPHPDDVAQAQPKRRPYNASASLSEYGVFPECDAAPAAQSPAKGADVALRHNWNEHLIEHNAPEYQHDFILFKVVEAYVLKHLADRQQCGGDVAAVLRQFLTGDGFIAECDIPHIVHALTARKGESNE